MKVLWFTNTPSLASEVLNENSNIGGWIVSLETELIKNEEVELGIAFHHGYTKTTEFKKGKTTYFPIPYPTSIKSGHTTGIISRWRHRIEPSNVVEAYLDVINQFKPDIVHVFGTEQAFGLLIGRVNVPVILQIQGNLSVYEKKWFAGLSYFDILKHSKIKTLIYGYGTWHLFYLFKKRAERERNFMHNCKYIIGRTDWDRRITRILSPHSDYFHCDELLRPDFLTSKKWKSAARSRKILFSTLSSMSYKGLESVLETASLLKKQSSIDFEWQIAGLNGSEELIQIIEKKYLLKFVDFNIKFIGNQNAANLINGLLNSDCYIHPSHIENSPNSVCEAMILGVPVVSTFTGGTSSLISNGLDGLLIQDGDSYVMAGTIIELLNSDELKNVISRNALITASQRHNPDKIIGDLLGIYKNIMST